MFMFLSYQKNYNNEEKVFKLVRDIKMSKKPSEVSFIVLYLKVALLPESVYRVVDIK